MNDTFVSFRKSRENWNRSVAFQFFAGFFLLDWANIFTFSGNHLFKIWWLKMFAICESITFAAIFNSLSGMLLAPVAFIWCTDFVILFIFSVETLGKLKTSGSLYFTFTSFILDLLLYSEIFFLQYMNHFQVQDPLYSDIWWSFNYSSWIIFRFRISYTTTSDVASATEVCIALMKYLLNSSATLLSLLIVILLNVLTLSDTGCRGWRGRGWQMESFLWLTLAVTP